MPDTTALRLPKELWEAPVDHSPPDTRPFVFHEIPQLRNLLPEYRGRPGLVYAQITNQNLRRAQDEGWKKVEGTVVYTIVGPKGHEADMELMVRGGLISGQSPDSGARLCVVDKTVEDITGLKIPVLWASPDPVEEKTTKVQEIEEKEKTNVRRAPKDRQASEESS